MHMCSTDLKVICHFFVRKLVHPSKEIGFAVKHDANLERQLMQFIPVKKDDMVALALLLIPITQRAEAVAARRHIRTIP